MDAYLYFGGWKPPLLGLRRFSRKWKNERFQWNL